MKKSKIVSTILMVIICICALAFGVYSVKKVTMSAQGTVHFDAKQVTCDINAVVTGAYNSEGVQIRGLDAQHTTQSSWTGLSWYFNDITANSLEEVEDIVVSFTITNTGNRSAYAYFTKDGTFIEYESIGTNSADVFLSSRSYIAAANTDNNFDILTMEIRFSLLKWESLGASFDYTLHVDDYASMVNATADAFEQISGNDSTGNLITGYSYKYAATTDVIFLSEEVINGGDITGIFNNGTSYKYSSPFCYGTAGSGVVTIKNIVIPTSWTIICDYLLNEGKDITGITIPKSINMINAEAFYRCNNIGFNHIKIPDSVESIGNSAFSYCTGLASLTISNSVTSIGSMAFYYCTSLLSVNIPDSVETIGDAAFSSCTGIISATIPQSKTNMGSSVFSMCSMLTSVILENGLTSIGNHMFYGCFKLTNINIPSSVQSIGKFAFDSCQSLTSVAIPNGITSIEESAFSSCIHLTNINIPSSVQTIGANAFSYCSDLTIINIPASVEEIGAYAFQHCYSLTSINIPAAVQNISPYTFYYCYGLTNIIIPNSVVSIGNNAFYYCSKLTSINIPSSVTSIGRYAFKGCTGLTSMIFNVASVSPKTWQYSSDEGSTWTPFTATTTITLNSSSTPTLANAKSYAFKQV